MELTKHWAAQLDDYVIGLAWAPDSTLLAAASAAGPLHLWDNAVGTRHAELTGHEDGTNVIAWHPRLPILASGGQDGIVRFWDPVAGQNTAAIELGNAWVDHLTWRPTGDACLAAAAGRTLSLVNPDGSLRHQFADAPKTISAIAWQPAGGCLASAYFGGIVLWDADDYVSQKEMSYGNGINVLAWSRDNRWLVSGNQDPSVHLWLLEEDQEFHMSGYETKVRDLSFSATGDRLATGGGRDVCIWDCAGPGPEGREPAMLPHDEPICGVAFQHQHGLLAAASTDGALMLWSPERRQPLRATIKLPAKPTALAWSPDDQYLAVGSEAGVVYVLKVNA